MLGDRRRLDTVVVLTVNYADRAEDGRLNLFSAQAKAVGSGGSMVARLKLKGIDGRAPPGVEPAA